MPALSVATKDTVHSVVHSEQPLLAIVTPLRWEVWQAELQAAGCLVEFADIPIGIRDGFRIGVSSAIHVSYIPRNHKSACDNPDAISTHINTELSARRYSGPFHPDRLRSLIGPFRTSPMGAIPKSTPGEWRIIQDLSFPRSDPLLMSVNAEIDATDFQCDWGTFVSCVLLIINAPPGTEASVNDVEKAFRIIPVHPGDQPHLAVSWNSQIFLDHCTAFGAASSPGIFGRVADACVRIFKHHGVQEVIKWVDDFVFWRYPISQDSDGTYVYSYSETLIFSIADHLGWPWSQAKHTPFADTFTYNGFDWSISSRTVQLPSAKKTKYLARLASWTSGAAQNTKEAESLIGTLNHCCLAIPEGRSRLPALYRFRAHLSHTANPFVRLPIPSLVLSDLAWWTRTLSQPFCGSTLYIPPLATGLDIFVDASTSWGIGLVINGRWMAWYLRSGWRSEGRNIGWAEMVAVELAIRYLIAEGYENTRVCIQSDNQGVIGALQAGYSRSSQQNQVLQRIVDLFASSGVWADTTYVHTSCNLADGPSRGIFPVAEKLPQHFTLPACLTTFVRRA